MLKIDRRSAALWQFGAPLAIGLVLIAVSGCSVPNMFGSDNSPLPLPPPLEADADGVVADKTDRKEEGKTDTAAKEDGEYPDLADVPEGAEATKAAEKAPEAQTQREQLAGQLVADREKAKYTDEELRGGKVAALSPPRPQPPAPPRAEQAGTPEAPQPVAPEAPAARVSPPAPAPVRAPAPEPGLPPASPPPSAAVPLTPQAPRSLPPRAAAVAPVQTATAYSSTTFQPSRAQPLPVDLAASLPAGVAQRYQETLRQPVPSAPAALPVAPVLGGRGGGAYVSIGFASGSSQLSSDDQRTIAKVASAAKGGFSRIRVVGHASSSASSQSESQRLLANWEVSQARATAVADELVRQGVDAARIVIEAVGDSQAASAAGHMDSEAAARRVDLFVE